MSNYYIYIYLDSRESGRYCYENFSFLYKPFYIGKGKNKRFEKINGRCNYFIDIINEIKKSGLKPIVIKLYENLNENKSLEIEKKLIDEIGRRNIKTGYLINKISGGQGSSGLIHTEITKNLISQKNKKNFSDIKKEFENRKYKLLSEENEYRNNFTKLRYICPKGHKSCIRWKEFKKEQGCKKCGNEFGSKKRRKNFQEIKNEFERRDYILLSEENEYINAFTKLKYICQNGHEGSIRWNDFQQGHGCLIEGNEIKNKKISKTISINKTNKGINNNNSKLKDGEVWLIKKILNSNYFKSGKITQKFIGKMFDVNQTIISKIKLEQLWSHVKYEEI